MTTSKTQPKIDWSLPANSVRVFSDRFVNAYFNKEWCSDMTFYVPKDERTVPAHSLFVAAASPVLERMCIGSDGLEGSMVVTIPDIYETEQLMVVLRYLYNGGSVEQYLESVNVTKLLMLSEYFDLLDLKNQCFRHLENTISPDNVCERFDLLHTGNSPLKKSCIKVMQLNMSHILKNGSAMRMSDGALKSLLDNDCLVIKNESELVEPMVKWAEEVCNEEQLIPNSTNLRKVLANRLYMIRFSTMDMDEFQKQLIRFGKGFFTDKEIMPIVNHIVFGPSDPIVPITIGLHEVSCVIRKFGTIKEKEESYSQGHSCVNFSSDSLIQIINSPVKNCKVSLTGMLLMSDSAKCSFHVINECSAEIIYKYTAGNSTNIKFEKRVPLDNITNGKWKLKFKTTDGSNLGLGVGHVLSQKPEHLMSSVRENTCIKSVSFVIENMTED